MNRHTLIALLLLTLPLVGCADQTTPASEEEAPASPRDTAGEVALPATPQTHLYRCDGPTITVRFDADSATVSLPGGGDVRLPRVPAASGAKYQAGDTLYWNEGMEALFEIGDQRYEGCRSLAASGPWAEAQQQGLDFRAAGNEPGWYLEIAEGDSLVMVADYGQRRVVIPTPAPETDDDSTVYAVPTEAHDLRVVITPMPCQDSMSGQSFEATVTVTLDGRTYEGCGRSL